MIALLPMLAIAGVVFVEQPLENVAIYTGVDEDARYRSWRCADVDRDGATDIVTPTSVAFQRGGMFPKAEQAPLPDLGDRPEADIWKGEIYVMQKDRIEVLRWFEGEWQRTLSQPITWAGAVDETNRSHLTLSYRTVSFNAFLYDVDRDGRPEIIRAASDGLHVYAKRDLFYEQAATWHILPPLRPLAAGHIQPHLDKRSAVVPGLEAWSEMRFSPGAASVLTFVPIGSARVVFHENTYTIAADSSLAVELAPQSSFQSPPVRNDVGAVRLNDDAIVDFLAVRFSGETGPPLPVPVIDVEVSTDGGKTFFKAQCTGANPERVLTDYNYDGRADLITESKRLDEGGLRETLVRGLTSRVVNLHMELRLQNGDGGFPVKATFARRFAITLDKPPANQSTMFLNFLSGKLVRLADVDGDRVADAAAHDRPDAITVYRGGASGITSDKLATLPIAAGDVFETVDVDEDGKSDILVRHQKDPNSPEALRHTVYLSRESAP